MAPNPIRSYDEGYLLCRNIGHAWKIHGYYKGAGDGTTRRYLSCERCETERHDKWDTKSADRLNGSYRYSPDYRLDADVQPSKQHVRAEVMRRATVYANEEQMLASLKNGGRRG
jgi:hypothetical protein